MRGLAKSEGKLSAPIFEITHADDPAISDFRNIRERDLVRHHQKLIIEGKVVLQHLLLKPKQLPSIQLLKILVLENRLDGLLPLLALVPKTTEIYVAKREIMDLIAGFPMHRGLLALADYRNPRRTDLVLSEFDWLEHLPQNALILVLSKISNHDNVGSIFRNAAAFGADFVVLDKECCHPFYRKAIRVSVGSVLTVPFQFGVELHPVFDALCEHDFQLYGLTPDADLSLSKLTPSKRNALVLGTEGAGLSQEHLRRLMNLKIEQTNAVDSLNVGTASGLALWKIANTLNRL